VGAATASVSTHGAGNAVATVDARFRGSVDVKSASGYTRMSAVRPATAALAVVTVPSIEERHVLDSTEAD
jgi:hypothetical protein